MLATFHQKRPTFRFQSDPPPKEPFGVLPSSGVNGNGRMNIILDLDSSMISSMKVKDYNRLKPHEKKSLSNLPAHNMEDYYYIFERPCLQEFLDYIFTHFNVSVWSAASKDYVLFIVNNILLKKRGVPQPQRRFKYVFYAYHCGLSYIQHNNPKKLDLLWATFGLYDFRPDNTILVDDLPDVRKTQLCNVFPIADFDVSHKNSEQDRALCDLLKRIKQATPGKCPVRSLA